MAHDIVGYVSFYLCLVNCLQARLDSDAECKYEYS